MKLFTAVCKSRDGSFFTTSHFYSSEEEAEAWLGDCLVGLFTSGPSIDDPKYEPIYPDVPMKKSLVVVHPVKSPIQKQNEEEKKEDPNLQGSWDQFLSPHIKG